ncbi:schlafen-like protein 1 [Mya arenaria]|uniref:schlafen-like protein 1 n=1 Tax=Mya arenaria TaxID=6604 RepID=UPI0022E804BB|nr:schlafen-like protein 1 [Mya arenaria]XP_052763934.1 schlafen-like protein 1 [Mya arenaria]
MEADEQLEEEIERTTSGVKIRIAQMAGPAQAQPSYHLPKMFRVGEHIGSEDRRTEFKEGAGFIKNDFRSNVAKYVSAFINCHENGRLFIGVKDNGDVKGYEMNQTLEDKMRRDIDEAIKDITPNIYPKDYSVDFIPVADENEYVSDGNRSVWYSVVICITVLGDRINTKGKLYSTRQGTFMRRDGGVQTLSAQDFHSFYQEKYQTKRTSLERNIQELLDTTREQQKEIEQLKRHQVENATVQGTVASKQTIEEIKTLRSIIESQHKKSKVCSIS